MRQPKVHSVVLLVREKGTARPFERREYRSTLQNAQRRLAEVTRYVESKGLEVGRPN